MEASGHDREYVIRFAGPVADERAFHGARARAAVIARSSSSENHRLAFGDAPATLEAMVRVRLRAVGAPLERLRGTRGAGRTVSGRSAATSIWTRRRLTPRAWASSRHPVELRPDHPCPPSSEQVG
ncbi:hypothetical protein [Nesterenkonia pannonica]|uniref:hypothetical protein n=1 Tax=Nesterenkonia pannonica TaxID=1548602 RepID=UPI00216493A7|nr:hypothetical protein [Nesterenkonia pannonica]